MDFYTYIWRDACGLPFYVGKGKGKRAYDTTTRSADFKEVYAHGGCTVEIADWFIHESQAHAHEVELIELYGRRVFGGLLVNKTDGGEGATGSVRSAETRAKISAAHVGKVISPETRAKMLGNTNMLGKLHSVETRAKIGAAHRGRRKSEEQRSKQSAAMLGRTPTEDHRGKLSSANRFAGPRIGLKGAFFETRRQKWFAQIRVDGKQRYLGSFETAEEAARAYDAAAIAAWGVGNCYLNFPTSVIGEAACIDPSRYQVRPNTEDARLAQTAEQ
ncbi:hypothetical protein GOL82_16390 [Sinorhizobium medicae]|nr:hypothetical protein [Sinorhizobium medicae]